VGLGQQQLKIKQWIKVSANCLGLGFIIYYKKAASIGDAKVCFFVKCVVFLALCFCCSCRQGSLNLLSSSFRCSWHFLSCSCLGIFFVVFFLSTFLPFLTMLLLSALLITCSYFGHSLPCPCFGRFLLCFCSRRSSLCFCYGHSLSCSCFGATYHALILSILHHALVLGLLAVLYFGDATTCTRWNCCSTFQGKLVFFSNLIDNLFYFLFCVLFVLMSFFCGCVVVLQDLSLPTN